ncbi:NAD-dependent epimerase dehydratase [Companilactobacillus paralimentarius DSM 13238 = JCM 10415]|jgi:NmrA-like family.|uniref:NAD-dependent epimerase dehydratase n=1 Tax=Companilactobacillus paralimentarius DSM 13238 = JCM 10415 TaxID=1122151 RepID=A0A0R1PGI2_9LACO|nr:NAD(P)H-binding protein [Companilactobacillus paralimentarius]KAE9563391.1 NAD(P)-dependent oxidoreductase [Companilactobacillus paralimentarius]KRL31305.1 NAD-dependent epimerase dehydratase [Companilactobacillus paralimentarius DSM 13238 = JCM 10415]QFR69125.1 NAD(P)H-binding protein [Companilactobacillus paralimentarius]
MTNVLVVGATGIIGQKVTRQLLDKTDDYLTLLARNTNILSIDEKREREVHGDVLDDKVLNEALDGNDIVLMATDSNLGLSVQRIIDGMKMKKIKRLIFITSMGLYNEMPVTDGASGNLAQDALLQPYRTAVSLIEDSELNYTILRATRLDAGKDINYDLVDKGEAPTSENVSYDSVVDYAVRLVNNGKLESHKNVEISRRAVAAK